MVGCKPVGAAFNYETMRMELVDFWCIDFQPSRSVNSVHTVSAGYVTGAVLYSPSQAIIC